MKAPADSTSTSGLRRVEWNQIVPLWYVGYWDGPLSGVCMFDSRPHWFETFADIHVRSRRYLLRELTDDRFELLETNQNRFAAAVGTHTYLDANWGRTGRVLESGWQAWYERDPSERADLSFVADTPVVGWFSRTPHQMRERSRRYWTERDRRNTHNAT